MINHSQGGFYATANGTTIAGFTFAGNTNSAFLGFGVLLGKGTSGDLIQNNIFTNNVSGLGLGASTTTITNNLFSYNNVATGAANGTAIYSDQFVAGTLSNVMINGNTFAGQQADAITLANGTANSQTNISITGNNFTNGLTAPGSTGGAVTLYDTTNSSITGNTISNTGAGAIYLGGGNNNITISNNGIATPQTRAIDVVNDGRYPTGANSNITVNSNTINADVSQLPAAGRPMIDLCGVGGTNLVVGNTIAFFTSGAQNPATGILIEGAGSGTFSVSGDTITNNFGTASAATQTTGFDIRAGTVTIGSGNSVDGGLVGIAIHGPDSMTQISGNTLNNLRLTNQSQYFIALYDTFLTGPVLLDASNVIFGDANLTPPGTAASFDAGKVCMFLELKIRDFLVDSTVGFVFLRPNLACSGINVGITGTNGADTININDTNPNNVLVTLNGRTFNMLSVGPNGRILLFTLNGNDYVNVSGEVPTEIHTGTGNDTVLGGDGPDVIFGGGGHNYFDGRGGNDVIVGGLGGSQLLGGGGNDILISGVINNAAYNNYNFLNMVRNEWAAANGNTALAPDLVTLSMNVTHPDTANARSALIGGNDANDTMHHTAFLYRKTGMFPDRLVNFRPGLDGDLPTS